MITAKCVVTTVGALASHLCGPGSIPGLGVRCGLSLLLVVLLALRGFSAGTPVFLFKKLTFLNSTVDTEDTVDRVDTVVEEPSCGCATANSHLLFIYLFIYALPTLN